LSITTTTSGTTILDETTKTLHDDSPAEKAKFQHVKLPLANGERKPQKVKAGDDYYYYYYYYDDDEDKANGTKIVQAASTSGVSNTRPAKDVYAARGPLKK